MQTIISQFGSLCSPALRWPSHCGSLLCRCVIWGFLLSQAIPAYDVLWRQALAIVLALCPGQCSGPSLLIQAFYPQPKGKKKTRKRNPRVNELLCAWYMEEIPLQSPEEKQKGSLPNLNSWTLFSFMGFPDGPSAKELACQCTRLRDTGLLPVTGRSPGGGHGNPLQNSCLGNPMDTGAWWVTVHRVAKSQTQLKWFSTHTQSFYNCPQRNYYVLITIELALFQS